LIPGGSSGFGLAATRTLAAHGMNLTIVHLDRRAVMPSIQTQFERVRAMGVSVCRFDSHAGNAEHPLLDDAAWINDALIRVDGSEHVAGI
jgi:enoyl-[acyl-carrier protein] reductase III